VKQGFARYRDDALIRRSAGVRRQSLIEFVRNVHADDGDVSVAQLEDVRASAVVETAPRARR